MPAFEYSALKPNGRKTRGVLEGDTERQVRQQLRARGLTPLEVRTVTERTATAGNRASLGPGGLRLGAADLALVTRQIATLVQSGSPLAEVLATVARQSEKDRVKRVVLAVRARVLEGHSLADSLSAFPAVFPPLYRATVAAGEQSGHLDAVLERLADYTESRQEMSRRVQGAIFYPATLIVISLVILAVLMGYVVPQVQGVYQNTGQQLPLLTRSLIALSGFIQHWWWALLLVIAGAVFLFLRALRNEPFRYRVHRLMLRLPVVGRLVRGLNTARFARTLSILAGSGVPILDALEISARVVPNLPMQRAIEEAAVRVREGSGIAAALERSGLFPPMTVHLIASGESSGRLEDMLERAALQQERETDATIGLFLSLFEPLLIVVMGGMVLLIVIAILLPIFELNSLVK
ncbi:MAG: type II secretion system protein GspF [Gammaproteobacteria bacterium]|nr:MAG: type II secretion system protein GspF [Gammaproteobacteria bacterium]